MKNLYFYGTLRHIPLLKIVLNRSAQNLDLSAAILPNYEVSSVAEGPFPMIEEREGKRAEGLLVQGLDAQDIARLDFYEGSFEYDLREITLADGKIAEVYVPQKGLWTPNGPWSLALWADQWGALSLFAAQEVMGYFGQRNRDDVAKLFPRIRARAAAQVNALQARHGAGTFRGEVEILHRARAYSHFYALDEIVLRHARFGGSMSDPIERAVFVGNDAAIVLPYDPTRDRVMLVEQIRMGPLARGDTSLWQLEPIAGGIDPGESPQDAARREAFEEAGLRLGRLEEIAEVYASPGNATEFYYIFLGLAELPDSTAGLGGLASEHEDIRSHVLSFTDFMALVDGFGASNAPLVLAANWLARHRDRLRSDKADVTPE